MKRLTKQQLKVVIALNFVLICLMGLAIFFVVSAASGLPANTTPPTNPNNPNNNNNNQPPPQYSRQRTANISLNPYLSWELEVISNGKAEAVFTYIREQTNTIFVFGNASAAGYDFDRAGPFLIALDAYGTTRENGFFSFGTATDKLIAVTNIEGGFVLAIDSQNSPYLLRIGFNGAVVERVDGFLNTNEKIHSIKHYQNGFLLFTRPQNNLTGVSGLRCLFFSHNLEFLGSSVANSITSIDPVQVFIISNRVVVFCSAHLLGAAKPVTIVEFVLGQSSRLTTLDNFSGNLAGVTVRNGNFVLCVGVDGAMIVQLNMQLALVGTPRVISSQRPIFFDDLCLNGGNLIVWFQNSGMILSSNFVNMSTILNLSPTSISFIGGNTIFAGTSTPPPTQTQGEEVVRVVMFADGNLALSALVGDGNSPVFAHSNRHLICIYNDSDTLVITSLRYPLFL